MHALTLDGPIELRPSHFVCRPVNELFFGGCLVLRWKSWCRIFWLLQSVGLSPFIGRFVVKFRKLRACFRETLRNLYDIRSIAPISLYTYTGGCAGELLGCGVPCFRKIGTREGARGDIRGRAVCLNEFGEGLRTAMRCSSVVIADHHPVVLQGLTNIFGAASAFKVVASCSDGTNCI
jgi:hypothetical protein